MLFYLKGTTPICKSCENCESFILRAPYQLSQVAKHHTNFYNFTTWQVLSDGNKMVGLCSGNNMVGLNTLKFACLRRELSFKCPWIKGYSSLALMLIDPWLLEEMMTLDETLLHNKKCYINNIFIINYRQLVVIGSNLNLLLKLVFCPTNNNSNNLPLRINCKSVVNIAFLITQ